MSVVTCTTAAMRLNHLTGRRTNSLGWAKSDCHTCASLHRHCDRQRPRCSPCLTEGATCAGYVQELNWDRGSQRAGTRRSKGSSGSLEGATLAKSTSQLPQPAAFTFIDQNDSQKRPRRRSRNSSKSSELSISQTSPVDIVVAGSSSCGEDSISSASPSSWSVFSLGTSPVTATEQRFDLPLSPRLRYHPGDVEYGLGLFHSCFAHTTLTFPVKVNPWQACLPALHEDHLPCVRYAAVALAQRQQAHLHGKPEGASILRLKAQALSLFASNLKDLSFESGLSTALLLIALDYAETGVSNWTVHLKGAYRILETNGGILLAESRPNLRAQIAMLVWYDVNAALISRCGPVFPKTYLEALMAWQADDEWSMLGLNGLPDKMFLTMHGLAVAAADHDCVDSATVDFLQKSILEANYQEGADKYQGLMSQVWRFALLLYCSRVFSRSLTSSLTVVELHGEDTVATFTETHLEPHSLALQILKMVSQIPSHSNYQKQCLMPIILAGCEMTANDGTYRKIAVEYSDRWKQKTGIWIFDSGLEFMRGVWASNDVESAIKTEDVEEGIRLPWTDVYQPSAGHGFLFG